MAATRCSCAHHDDGSVTTMLCSLHADQDPCQRMAAVTGRRRKGSIVRGVCSACGWSAKAADTALVRLSSHRAADRLARLLGLGSSRELDWHYTWADGGTFAMIPADRLAEARKIPSVTLARPKGQARRCYDH